MVKSELLVLAKATSTALRQKQKEERRRVVRLCVNKLQKMHDPESFLCRSVLINNTLKNIQLDIKEAQRKSRLKRERPDDDTEEEIDAKKVCIADIDDEYITNSDCNSQNSSYYSDSHSIVGDSDTVVDNEVTVTSDGENNYYSHIHQDNSFWLEDSSKSTIDISVISGNYQICGIDYSVSEETSEPFYCNVHHATDEAITSDSSGEDNDTPSDSDNDLSAESSSETDPFAGHWDIPNLLTNSSQVEVRN